MTNKVFLVMDSLRWDVFKKARAPFLKSLGEWKKAYTPGNYTFPAHMSFFVGKLPQTFTNEDYYDTIAIRVKQGKQPPRRRQLWRLSNPEAPRPSRDVLEGKTIIDGFRKKGYLTVATGGVAWFNPDLPGGKHLTEPFDKVKFFGGPNFASLHSAEPQIDWALSVLGNHPGPYFLFINFGETHHRFVHQGCSWMDGPNPYGDHKECFRRQKACLEYLDGRINGLLGGLRDYELVVCSDHGEAMGEDGLWGHGFHHPTILEVPLLIKPMAGD